MKWQTFSAYELYLEFIFCSPRENAPELSDPRTGWDLIMLDTRDWILRSSRLVWLAVALSPVEALSSILQVFFLKGGVLLLEGIFGTRVHPIPCIN